MSGRRIRTSSRSSSRGHAPTKSKSQSLADAQAYRDRLQGKKSASKTTTRIKNTGPSSKSRRRGTVTVETMSRMNKSTQAEFPEEAFKNPMQGTFMNVVVGRYTDGPRAGEKCVLKWFKEDYGGLVFESSCYREDLNNVEATKRLVKKFNNARIIDKHVTVNVPEVWCSIDFAPGSKVIVEPYIENYKKQNSNSGYANNSTEWGRAMQALSHFTYHASGGKQLLCDIQGGVYDKAIVLTDPVIMSTDQCFGLTDLGEAGIFNWFSHHKCNEYCSRSWKLPDKAATSSMKKFRAVAHTQMMPLPRKASSRSSLTSTRRHVGTAGPTYERFK